VSATSPHSPSCELYKCCDLKEHISNAFGACLAPFRPKKGCFYPIGVTGMTSPEG
jgi:hypothetical protein